MIQINDDDDMNFFDSELYRKSSPNRFVYLFGRELLAPYRRRYLFSLRVGNGYYLCGFDQELICTQNRNFEALNASKTVVL